MSRKLYDFMVINADSQEDGGSGQFTGGYYSEVFILDGVTYEFGLEYNYPEYCELISVNGRSL